MWSRLSMWVMAPSKAYRIDDRDGWVFYVVDGEQQPFAWKGIDYTAGIAASTNGYTDFEVPPGTYVTWASRTAQGETLTTHRAVVAVHDEPVVTVRLLPNVPPTPPDDGGSGGKCEITIDKAEGKASGDSSYPDKIVVTGTAVDCPEVHVVVRGPHGNTVEGDVSVGANGVWQFDFPNELKVRCGEVVLVDAWCTEDKRCRSRHELPVKCRRSKGTARG
jgi:hypothetical protein